MARVLTLKHWPSAALYNSQTNVIFDDNFFEMTTTAALQFAFETLKNLGQGVLITAIDFTILNANSNANKLLNVPELTLNGQKATAFFVHNPSEKTIEIPSQSILAAQGCLPCGQNLFSLVANCIQLPNGETIGYSIVFNRFDAAAAADTNMVNTVIDNTTDAIVNVNLQGTILTWNKVAKDLFGYDCAEAVGENQTMLTPSHLLNEQQSNMDWLANGETLVNDRIMKRTKNGSTIHVFERAFPIKNIEGKVVKVCYIYKDLSIEMQAAEKQTFLAAIIESSDDAIISKDLNGIISTWNKGAENIFGYTEQEAIGKPIIMLIPAERLNEENEILDNIKKGLRVEHFQTIRVHKNGHPLDVSLTISPIKDLYGNIIGASKVARDISRQKHAERELAVTNVKLNELSRRKDDFIAMATHELKTPLTSLGGFLQVLQHRYNNEQTKPLMDKVMKQLHKLNSLFNDLFDISRIEAGKLQLNFELLDACSLVSDIVESYRETSPDHIFEINGEKNCLITADKMRLEQALTNLINNAIKYSSANTKITVQLSKQSNNIIVDVIDNGIGIGKAYQQNIFSQFYRTRDVSGTIAGLGLGLFITKQIVERHNGTITVDSMPNQGTTFTVTLPIEQPHVEQINTI